MSRRSETGERNTGGLTAGPETSPVTAGVVLTAALAYRDAGLSIIPIIPDGSKSPAWCLLPRVPSEGGGEGKHAWKPFQARIATEAEVRPWYEQWGPLCGIAVIGGKVSGGLEVIDFDTIDLFGPWSAQVEDLAPGLIDRLVHVQTPRPGRHVFFRCQAMEGNQKLARQLVINKETGNLEVKTLIETKSEGGYVLVPPSPPACHPSGRGYVFVGEKDLGQVPTITPEERNILLDTARSFNKCTNSEKVAPCRRPTARKTHRRHRPGDDFNVRARWADVLEPHGWVPVHVGSGDVEYWRRPGKVDGTSATINHGGHDLFHVFSTNAPPFESEHSYNKFQAYALLEHGGDFTAAAQALRAQGYGSAALPAGNRNSSKKARRRGRLWFDSYKKS